MATEVSIIICTNFYRNLDELEYFKGPKHFFAACDQNLDPVVSDTSPIGFHISAAIFSAINYLWYLICRKIALVWSNFVALN